MKTLSIEVRTVDTAYGFSSALVAFNAEVIDQAGGGFLVKVDLSDGRADIVSVLNAIHQYVSSSDVGPPVIDMDGRTYIMEPSG
jgi:hypothetical protein